MSAWALLAVAAFVLLLAFVVWMAWRQQRELDDWLERKIRLDGWTTPPDDSPIAEQGWNWFQSLRTARDIRIDRLAVKPVPDLVEGAFTLITRAYGARAGGKRHVGVGLIARLSRPISPTLVATPVPRQAGGAFLSWFVGIDLPAVPMGEGPLAQRWTFFSPEPQRAAERLASDDGLRSALARIFDEAVVERTLFQVLILEFNGKRAALLGGPKMVGRQPFSDLEHLAGVLSQGLS